MTELEGYKDEAKRCRDEEHKTKVAAQEMQRKLLDEVDARTLERDEVVKACRDLTTELTALKAKYTELSTQYTAIARKEHGWPWVLEQLAEGKKVTHPILQGVLRMPDEIGGWIEKIGEGSRGTIYEIHESYYCYSRVMESENGWELIVSKARQSIGWRVIP